MKRVMIIGSSGSGKSTLARRLGAIMRLPVIHIDQFYWSPGWVLRPLADVRADIARLVAEPSWIFDGNNSSSFDLRIARADTLVFLDLPRAVCLSRVLWRLATSYGKVRPDLAPGCPERFDLPFLRWVYDYPRRGRPKALQLLADAPPTVTTHHLRDRKAIARWLVAVSDNGTMR